MTQQPGWYNDEVDPALARWFNGTGWTVHTIVKAEWTGSEMPPAPEEPSPAVASAAPLTFGDELTGAPERPASDVADAPTASYASVGFDDAADLAVDPTFVGRFDGYDDAAWDDSAWSASDDEDAFFEQPHPAGPVYGGRHLAAGAGSGRPAWFGLAAAAAVVALVVVGVVALFGGGDEGGDDVAEGELTSYGDLDEAVAAARTGLTVDVGDGDLEALIRGLCFANDADDTDSVARDATLAVSDPTNLDPVLTAAARGAAVYCPDRSAATDGVVDAVLAAATIELSVSTTVPEGAITDDGAGTDSPAATTQSTTKKGSTGTTATTKKPSNSVTRTETSSKSSTSPSLPNSGTSPDQSNTGNSGNTNDETKLTIKPTTTTPTTTADTTASTTPGNPP